MLTDYLAIGSQEVWSTPRLRAYLASVGSPFTSGTDICGCDTLTADALGDEPYTTPDDTTSPAPWWDPDIPESAEFLGFLPLTITGLEDNPRARNVTNAVGGGGVFGPVRALPRTITVTGLLIGTSCCAAEFGVHWLAEALAGCTGDSCEGDCVAMYNCCPDQEMTQEELTERHRRTLRSTALVSGPTVLDRTGTGSCARGNCSVAGDIIQVEFVLVAASPWAWAETIPLLDVDLPIGGTGDCIDWCLSNRGPGQTHGCAPSECQFADCDAASDACADPRSPVPAPPQPTAPQASFCVPLATQRDCYTIDLTNRPQWSNDVPMVTLTAGSSDLRNVRITFYEKQDDTTLDCDEIADANRCAPQNDFVITFIPAGGSVTIDGQTGRATSECAGDCRTASTVFGSQDGGPVRVRPLDCAQYCVCVETDPLFPPAADAGLSLGVSGRGY